MLRRVSASSLCFFFFLLGLKGGLPTQPLQTEKKEARIFFVSGSPLGISFRRTNEPQKRKKLQTVKTKPAEKLRIPAVVVRATKRPLPPHQARQLGWWLARRRGWASEWACLRSLWEEESRWRVFALNPDSGAYGIPQALPGGKMRSHGPDWRWNAITQIRWGMDYIASRYSRPCQAWEYYRRHNWY